MRAARIPCTVGGIFSALSDRGELHRGAIADQRTLVQQHLHRLFHEERVALGLLGDQSLERNQIFFVAEQRGQHFLGALLAERIEPKLRVVGLPIGKA